MGIASIRTSIVPGRVAFWLWVTLLVLILAHAAGLVMTYRFGHSHLYGLVPLFNLGLESNVPTFVASLLLLSSALLFLFLWRVDGTGDGPNNAWLLLAAVFGFLSLDEFSMIHEKLIEPVRDALDVGGLLFFAWIIPYAIAALVLALAVAPTIWRLETPFQALLALAAALYLSGAIGVEMIGGRYYEAQGEVADLTYRLYQTLEESLEFAGAIVLIYTLLHLVGARAPVTIVQIDFEPRTEPVARFSISPEGGSEDPPLHDGGRV